MLNEAEAKAEPCLSGNPSVGRIEWLNARTSRRLCIGSACRLGWRRDKNSLNTTKRSVVSLNSEETPFGHVYPHGEHSLRYHPDGSHRSIPRDLDHWVKNEWQPRPPDNDHEWRLKNKSVVNWSGGAGHWDVRAIFERDLLDSELFGYCGLAGAPRT